MPTTSLWDRYIARPKKPWGPIAAVLVIVAAPFLVAWLEGADLTLEAWRGVMIPPAIIAYIFLLAPRLVAMEDRVMTALRALMEEDPATLAREAQEAEAKALTRELLAFGAGLAFYLVFGLRNLGQTQSWTQAVLSFETFAMYGLLGVVIYGSTDRTRGFGAMLRRNLRVDPLDVAPFDAVGRHSLALALVFVGGITLSLVFVWVTPAVLILTEFWLVYAPLAAMPFVIFFVNMLPTHRLLARARDRDLRRVDLLIREDCAALVSKAEEGQEVAGLSQRLLALTAYESRLLQARTWPYDTAMLRTVFVSVLVPGGTVVGRLVLEALNR
ncbi:MAG: hypothetical protein FJZ97_03150 [Chloroflexi bacterium]|nr:hypothetical protein [Chloroflexota bacterium]